MDMNGESRIEAPRERVWQALNDPEILKASIAGCEELDRTAENEFTAKVKAKVGPVSARFSGKVTLLDLDPPNGYRIQGEGTGGVAGFAKGGATVALEEDGGATILRYDVQAQVGGKLAQIGSRLIAGTARKMADDFFKRFREQVEAGGEDSGSGGEGGAAEGGSSPTGGGTGTASPVVPLAGATADKPAAMPSTGTAPETSSSLDADTAAAPGHARTGPEMARAATPSRSVVTPELDAELPPSGPNQGGREGRPTTDTPR